MTTATFDSDDLVEELRRVKFSQRCKWDWAATMFNSGDLVEELHRVRFNQKWEWDATKANSIPVPGLSVGGITSDTILCSGFRDIFETNTPNALLETWIDVIRCTTNGYMKNHTKSFYPGLYYQWILLAPNYGEYSYTGGDLIVDGNTFKASTTPGEWVAVAIKPGFSHSVSLVTSGTMIAIMFDCKVPLTFQDIQFIPVFGTPTTETCNYAAAEEDYRHAQLECAKAAETLRIATFDNNPVYMDTQPKATDFDDESCIVVVLYGYYEGGVYSLDNLEYCDARFLENILDVSLVWAFKNTSVSCFVRKTSGEGEWSKEETVLEGHVVGSNGHLDDRDEDARIPHVTLPSMLEKFATKVFYNTCDCELGRPRVELDSWFDDRYTSYFKIYDVSMLIFKKTANKYH